MEGNDFNIISCSKDITKYWLKSLKAIIISKLMLLNLITYLDFKIKVEIT